MKKRAKIFISYLMLLLLVFTSVFANPELSKAASLRLPGHDFNLSLSDGVETTVVNDQTTYKLTKDVAINSDLILTLQNSETVILDGNGFKLSSNTFEISGQGTLVLQNITVDGVTRGIKTTGDKVNLVFRGSKPIVIKSGDIAGDSTQFNSTLELHALTSITVCDNANVTINGKIKRETDLNGPGDYSTPSVFYNCPLFITRGENSQLNLINGRLYVNGVDQTDKIGFQIGTIESPLYLPAKQLTDNSTNVYENSGGLTLNKNFNISVVTEGKTVRTDEYTSTTTAVPSNLLPFYFGDKYQLIGYFTDATCTTPLGEGFEFSESHNTLYAKCNQVMGDITFAANGGSAVSSQRIDINSKVTKPADPTKAGYTFAGWYKDSTLAKAYDFSTPVTNDFTLYAKWNKIEPPVTNQDTTKSKTPAKKKFSVPKSLVRSNSLKMNMKLSLSFKDKKLTLTWNQVKDITGYKIYAAKCGQKLKYIKTVKGEASDATTITKINGKKLSNKNTYKVYAKAYKMVDGKAYTYAKSLVAHCTGTDNNKFTNAVSLECKKKSKTLEQNATFKMKVKVTKQNSNKKFLPTDHCARLRYFSSNPNVATVSSSGKITAIGKGKCSIYALAMNGKSTKMTIKVDAKK